MASFQNTPARHADRQVIPIQRPDALNDIMLSRLRDDIVSGIFQFGERLSEDRLSKLYGVTKAPVRSALLKLQAEGLLKIVPQRGAFVMDPSLEEVRALCELRIALELEAVRLAFQRNREALSARLSEIIVQMEPHSKSVQNDAYQALDFQLHHAFFQAAESEMLESTYLSIVRWRFSALRRRLSHNERLAARSFREHAQIRDLVAENNYYAATTIIRAHIGYMIDYFTESLENR